ncbi:hypothetical protein M011DRAFT_469988 [Sporormia fimetaria CBS 119925]|uniref:Uncharacterized protein n=1 Tax=Sporormia fimetaria CBS 119925 TaxID=1340428 RepID=A0A6A6V4I0_9PLEO|nr:hypothetical protein M011DRAFT_469988 [Sporormia fimetaria CBS 119925]
MRSDEYSKSGGDDIVAEQRSSFTSIYTDPIMEREVAGRGYVINPLDVSPASPEWSMIVEEQIVEKNADRRPGDRTGYGVTRKTKMVEKNDLDFRMKERRRGMAKA